MQLFMRCAGLSKDAREAFNFNDGVSILCIQSDFNMVQHLYDFTNKALEFGGTGQIKDLVDWMTKEFDNIR